MQLHCQLPRLHHQNSRLAWQPKLHSQIPCECLWKAGAWSHPRLCQTLVRLKLCNGKCKWTNPIGVKETTMPWEDALVAFHVHFQVLTNWIYTIRCSVLVLYLRSKKGVQGPCLQIGWQSLLARASRKPQERQLRVVHLDWKYERHRFLQQRIFLDV